MDVLGLILVLILITAILIGAVVLALRWFWNRAGFGKAMAVLIAGALVVLIYRAVFPDDSFYRDEYKNVTGLEFPERGVVLRKTSAFPDFGGDYSSCAVIKVSEKDFERLKASMPPSLPGENPVQNVCAMRLWKDEEILKETFTGFDAGGEYRYWALHRNRREVMIQFSKI